MRQTLAALIVASTAALSGCLFSHGQIDVLGSGTAFDEANERFNRLVRWGHWEMAAQMVAEDQRDHFVEAMDRLGDVRFTDWEVLVMNVAEGFGTAHVEIRLEGYRQSSLVYYEGVLVQEWERTDAVQSTWVVRPDVDALAGAFAAN